MLGIGAVIVLHKHHAHLVRHIRIGVDHLRKLVDIFDNGLCADIARRGFRAEEIGRRGKLGNPAILDAIVGVQNAKCIEQLTFVFVHALYLHVKDEIRRQIDALALLNQLAQLRFLQPLDLIKLLDIGI
ncbi:hypothetical protein SDC9_126308 [bioreactor metagenome]|uniref:Uncharacterized protein n=1 Tax=bioreactor metagenome TaxID=1076179 RepID=A0A645CQU7_9ZZZZ